MRKPPQWTEALHFPATAGTWILALAATIAWWAKVDCSLLFEDAHVAHGELWRLLTSALLHGDPLHLAFNLYWLWVFGTLIEQNLGSLATLGLFALFAAASGAAEVAILDGGVGLSVVGYGMFGMLWVLRGRDPRFDGGVDSRTIALFIAWFFFCIVLTVNRVYPVANIAHAAGAIAGVAVGWAMTRRASLRRVAWGLPGTLTLLCLAAATFARPYINRSSHRGTQESYYGYEALAENRNAQAVGWLHESTTMQPNSPIAWYNLGIAYQRLDQFEQARDAYQHAMTQAPDDQDYRQAFDLIDAYLRAQTGERPQSPPMPATPAATPPT